MTKQRMLSVLLASTLWLSPMHALAQTGPNDAQFAFPPASEPDNGGTLGFTFDTQVYQRDGLYMFRVADIDANSPLCGVVHVGDYIYNVNGFYLRTSDDIVKVVHSGSPGTELTISYLDASDNLAAKGYKANLIAAPGAQIAATKPWCLQSNGQLATCAVGAVVVAKIIGSLLSGSNGSSSSASGSYSSSPGSSSDENARFNMWVQKNRDAGLNDNGTQK